ncbi:MAG: hypothetical protein AAF098_06745 [Pseudomonadota bacterium]
MALKKRSRRTKPDIAPVEEARASTLDSKRTSATVSQQLNERLTRGEGNGAEPVRLEKKSLSKIVPDPENQRTWFMNPGSISILASTFESVWQSSAKTAELPDEVHRKCLDQIARYAHSLNRDLPPMDDVSETVHSVWDFAVHLKTEPLLQPFGVTAWQDGKYQVTFGNRRYIASCIAHGNTHTLEVILFLASPKFPASKRFVENNQRADLPLQAKVEDYRKAVSEIRSNAQGRVSNVEIANRLGIGRNLVQKLDKISASAAVKLLIMTGQVRSVEYAYRLSVLEDSDNVLFKAACKAIAEHGEPKGDFNAFRAMLDSIESKTPKRATRKTVGRPSKIKIPAVSEPEVLQRLFAPEILASPDWSQVDWSDGSKPNISHIEKLIKKTLEDLVSELQGRG